MAQNSRIGWTTATWNPSTGCTQVSPGCDNCYAKRIAEDPRMSKGFPKQFNMHMKWKKILEPMSWKKPSLIFVNSMSDLFHKEITDDFLIQVWDVMLEANWHIYQILTKRPHRMAYKVKQLNLQTPDNIWLGTSVENQKYAHSRLSALISIPDTKRFVSCEPLLGPVNLRPWIQDLHWIIDGGESGPGRRQADYNWFREIRDVCIEHEVPYFHKQGNHYKSGQDMMLDGQLWQEFPKRFATAQREERKRQIEAETAQQLTLI